MLRDNPGLLTLDEAYDVAGFVSSLKRPEFKEVKLKIKVYEILVLFNIVDWISRSLF